jgi:hypothetical protein
MLGACVMLHHSQRSSAASHLEVQPLSVEKALVVVNIPPSIMKDKIVKVQPSIILQNTLLVQIHFVALLRDYYPYFLEA